MSTSARASFETQTRADWADIPALADVRVIATERNLGELVQPLALIRQRSIAREPAAPLSMRRYGMLLTIVSAHADMDAATDELDVLVGAAIDYLDTRYEHDAATAVMYVDRLAYDIPVTITASKD